MKRVTSSRKRYEEFRQDFRKGFSKHEGGGGYHGARAGPSKESRDRSAMELVRGFLGLLSPHKWSIAFSLATLTVSTLLSLTRPAATKFLVDNVLAGLPLPDSTPDWVPREPHALLYLIVAAVLVITLVQISVHIINCLYN